MKDKIMDFFNKNKKAVIIGAVALVAVIIAVFIGLVCCGGSNNGKKDNKGPVEYTLNIQTPGGLVFEGVNIYVYEQKNTDNLLFAGKSDENGQFKFTTAADPNGFGYRLEGLPTEGYEIKDMYSLTSKDEKTNQLYLCVDMVVKPLDDMANTKFKLGSVIKDFTVKTPDGKEATISALLKEKDAVVLNFFYLACQPCKSEFPYLEEAYKKYSNDIAVIAMTPVDKDDAAIKSFADELGLTFYVAQCDSQWEQMMNISAYPTTVVIDKWGMISFMHTGTVTEAGVFESIFTYYSNDDYVQKTVKYLEDIVNAEAEEGTQGNPITILPDASDFEAKVAAGKEVYFELPKVTNMIMTINDADAYVIYNEEKYEAKDGVVSLVVSAPDSFTPAQFVVGNKGTSDKTFKATLEAVKGTMMNPYEFTLGAMSTDVAAGNEQGVYYKFVAKESGTLTYKPVSVTNNAGYDVTLYNLNTYVNNTLSANANADGTVSIVVNAGDDVQVVIGTTPNADNEYPAATISGEVSFVAGEGTGSNNNAEDVEYTVTVKDADGKAMSGVQITIDTAEATTDASGAAKVTLKSGSYVVGITCPTGYKLQGEVTISAETPNVTATLVSTVAKQVKYTVKVTDENGKAINGATVIVGSSTATTNTSGTATVTLAEGSYDVAVSANGYVTGSGKVTKTSTSVTIKLKKNAAADTGVTYTVKVVDYKGTGQKGLTVMLKNNGTPVATATTDNNGVATVKLAKGTYDIVVAFAGGNNGFDKSTAQVTASKTSTTITVAPKASATEEVYFDKTDAYYITEGGQYVTIPAEDIKKNEGKNAYFLFEPTKSGTYKISLTNANATISYWGASTFFIANSTSEIEHTNTSITLNVKDSNIGSTYVIGVKGTDDCIINVIRTGDAVLDANDMEWTEYVGSDKVKPYTFGGGTLTYVDITKPTSTYNLVYNTTDGYYHLGTANGPVMLVHLGTGAPCVALSDVIGYTGTGGSNFGKYIYNGKTLIKKERYNSLLENYMKNMDPNKFVYPLTKDLMYIMKNGGEQRGWWSSNTQGNVVYTTYPNLNPEIAWMFACCYVAN